jgi:hypothetical protein
MRLRVQYFLVDLMILAIAFGDRLSLSSSQVGFHSHFVRRMLGSFAWHFLIKIIIQQHQINNLK